MRGNPVLQFQKSIQPVRLGFSERLDRREAVGSANHRTESNDHDFVEAVLLALSAAWVFNLRKLTSNVVSWVVLGCRHRIRKRVLLGW